MRRSASRTGFVLVRIFYGRKNGQGLISPLIVGPVFSNEASNPHPSVTSSTPSTHPSTTSSTPHDLLTVAFEEEQSGDSEEEDPAAPRTQDEPFIDSPSWYQLNSYQRVYLS
jgi:hypothetical protein